MSVSRPLPTCQDLLGSLSEGPYRTLALRFQSANKHGKGNCHGELVISLKEGIFMIIVTRFDNRALARDGFLNGPEPVANASGEREGNFGIYYQGWPGPDIPLPPGRETGCRLAFQEGNYHMVLLRPGDQPVGPCSPEAMPTEVQNSLRLLLLEFGRNI